MHIISHRGNLDGPDPKKENRPDTIVDALRYVDFVEIDVRMTNGCLFLGHDRGTYEVEIGFLRKYKDRLIIHCKNLKALELFMKLSEDFHFFWHQEDDYTLTSKRILWVYPGKPTVPGSILVHKEIPTNVDETLWGVCTDYPIRLI